MILTSITSLFHRYKICRLRLSSTLSSSISIDEEALKISTFIASSHNLLIITGAGMSTSSGIPDYRSPEGSYSKGHKPIINADFINSEYSRKRYWARSMVGYAVFSKAQPNDGHYSLARIESRNINKSLLVTQNVDRLHQKAGSRNVIDLHGRNDKLICLSCSCKMSRTIIQKQIELLNPDIAIKVKSLINNKSNLRADGDANLDGLIDYETFNIPNCPKCTKGILKPDVVFFGDNVKTSKVQDIYNAADESDGLLIVGTSLEVWSAYRFVDRFAKKSNKICIINSGKTRADSSNLQISIRSESNCTILLKKTADLIDKFYYANSR